MSDIKEFKPISGWGLEVTTGDVLKARLRIRTTLDPEEITVLVDEKESDRKWVAQLEVVSSREVEIEDEFSQEFLITVEGEVGDGFTVEGGTYAITDLRVSFVQTEDLGDGAVIITSGWADLSSLLTAFEQGADVHSYENVPDPALDFSCKSENPPTNPDVLVDVKEDGRWVRLPVTHTELFINKDGPADITRTAKIKFPAEWGKSNISRYINGFQAQDTPETGDPYDECRIFMRDQYEEEWQIVHYGYVGGVGPAAENGVFKFWCYDPADLMKGIQVSKSFGEPTIATVMNFVLNGEDDNGRPVGINKRSVFSNIKPYIAGTQEVKLQKQDNWSVDGPIILNTLDAIDDLYDFLAGTEQTRGLLAGQKRFQINRHNMVDLMNWFAAEVGGKWHFEPTPEGPILFFDNTSSRGIERPDGDIARRVFVENNIIDEDQIDPAEASEGVGPSGFTDKNVFSPVDTLNNSALADIKPFNTLVLFGEAGNYRQRYADTYQSAGSPGAYTEVYPYVKLVYEPLLDRAGGYEYSAPPVESDKVYLEQAKKQAIEEFRQHISEETEGEITLKGEPHILPYDYLRTIPVCNDTFPNAGADPITYEVNAVKHVRSAGDRYKTKLRCSITFAEDDLDIQAEFKEA